MADVVSTDGGWSGGDPDAVTGWTLVRAYHVVARRFVDVLATVGLTPTQFGVLVQLVDQPGVSQAELARRVLVTPQSVGELLASLERLDLVRRVPGRRGTPTAVEITDEGRAALQRATPVVGALNAPASLGLTAQESATLNTLLHKVLRASADGRTRDPAAGGPRAGVRVDGDGQETVRARGDVRRADPPGGRPP